VLLVDQFGDPVVQVVVHAVQPAPVPAPATIPPVDLRLASQRR
jgi:hypothetical protein